MVHCGGARDCNGSGLDGRSSPKSMSISICSFIARLPSYPWTKNAFHIHTRWISNYPWSNGNTWKQQSSTKCTDDNENIANNIPNQHKGDFCALDFKDVWLALFTKSEPLTLDIHWVKYISMSNFWVGGYPPHEIHRREIHSILVSSDQISVDTQIHG